MMHFFGIHNFEYSVPYTVKCNYYLGKMNEHIESRLLDQEKKQKGKLISRAY